MKKFWEEFKKFISKGNILDLAVAVIIGAAFGKIVTSLVNDMLMPLISLVFTACGLKGFADWKWEIFDKHGAVAATLNYGVFIQTVLDFFIIALCIFVIFKLIKRASGGVRNTAKKLSAKNKKAAGEAPAPEGVVTPKEPTTNELLAQIRDLLSAQNTSPVSADDAKKE